MSNIIYQFIATATMMMMNKTAKMIQMRQHQMNQMIMNQMMKIVTCIQVRMKQWCECGYNSNVIITTVLYFQFAFLTLGYIGVVLWCFDFVFVEIIATIFGGYDVNTVLVKDICIIVQVSSDNGAIAMSMYSEEEEMEQIVGMQKKQAYSHLLKYLFNVAIFGIVSKESGIYVDNAEYNYK